MSHLAFMREEPFELEATSRTPIALALPDKNLSGALRAGESDGREALLIGTTHDAASFGTHASIFLPATKGLPAFRRAISRKREPSGRKREIRQEIMERLKAVVHGYVQGVGFRAFVAREGRRLGLVGEVANRPDGGVEVMAEGERPRLEELLRLLHRGPSEAEVQRVEAQWLPAGGAYTGFHIRL